jgi:biotin--protein ligase
MLYLRSYTAIKLSAEDVVSGEWTRNLVGIVFPGGRDSPYHEKLEGDGNKLIRRFVEEGGWYLGICAGKHCSHILPQIVKVYL